MDEGSGHRTYFFVTDEDGNGFPAMEYLAGTLDERPVFEVTPLKRFVKLIGSGEHLMSRGDGRFIGCSNRRTYCAQTGRARDPAKAQVE